MQETVFCLRWLSPTRGILSVLGDLDSLCAVAAGLDNQKLQFKVTTLYGATLTRQQLNWHFSNLLEEGSQFSRDEKHRK